MDQTFNRSVRSYSLPKLQKTTFGESKLFQNSEQLSQTKKIFLERVQAKQQAKTASQESERFNPIRSFIQFPKQSVQQGFTSFKQINKNETDLMFEEIKNLRSRSTLLKPFIKAQILFNKAAHEKIKQANEVRVKEQREYIAKRIKQLTPALMKKQVKIKQKFKNKTKNIKKITLQMNFKVYEQNLHCWKPYIDFDALAVPIKEEVFFIGGRKQTPPVVYNAIQSTWKELPEIPGMKCFGETDPVVIQNRKIVCFGGYDYFQQGFSLITNNLKTIDLKAKTIQVQEFNEVKTAFRAFHSQCLYGKFLIVSGGIDKNNKLFHNFMNFNVEKKYWNQLTIQKMPERLKLGFAKHNTLSVFHTRNTYSIYDNEEITEYDPNIKEEGIYIYGGEDGNGEMIGEMCIMRLGEPSIVIEQLKIEGAPPIPRRNARMIRHKEYIILHGGRNDQMKPSILNSMHFLHLKSLNWIKVGGQKPPYRHSHSLTIVNDQIVILGGKGLDGLSKQVFIIPYEEQFQYI